MLLETLEISCSGKRGSIIAMITVTIFIIFVQARITRCFPSSVLHGLFMDYQGNTLSDFLKTNGQVVLQRVTNYNLRSFTEKEIEHITNGYSALLGKGAFSEVY